MEVLFRDVRMLPEKQDCRQMKNILLITPLYPIPAPENNATDVCHSFAKEWVKQGYNVLVVHLQPVHCAAWHLLIRIWGKQIANLVGGGNFYAKRLRKTEHYEMDGVPVYRIPVYNFIPHGRFPARSVDGFVSEVLSILKERDFRPDVITGHMMPMEIIPQINKSLGTVTCNVEHGVPKKIRKRYEDYESIISSYDMYGFRSNDIRKRFESEVCKVPNPFICYSGIPQSYLEDQKERDSDAPVQDFIYVGEFIKRKYPSIVAPAIRDAFGNDPFSLTLVGEGPEKEEIEKLASAYGVSDRIRFTGKIPRAQIKACYDAADCMIMISEREAFGLVYLEAMARGCIPVASRNEGIDGVIVDGENGFLCEAGNQAELSSIIKRIREMSPEERRRISEAAAATAERMTDAEVARDYAEQLLSHEG